MKYGKKTGERSPKHMLSFIISSCSPMTKKHSFGAKPLLKMATGETLLQYQVRTIRESFPDSEIILTIGFEADKVLRHARGVRIVENRDYKNNLTGDIRMAINASAGEETVYISGDLIFNKQSLGIINGHSTILLDSKNGINKDDVGATVIDEHVTILSYGLGSPKWGKMAFFTKTDTQHLYDIFNERYSVKKMFFEIINELIETKYRSIRAYEPNNSEIKVYS